MYRTNFVQNNRLAEEEEEETFEANYEEGIAEGEARIIKILLDKGNSIETISAMTGISKEEIEKLIDEEYGL